MLSPFMLVTTSDDGIARVWDIRNAALKRCSSVIRRVDYTLPKIKKASSTSEHVRSETAMDTAAYEVALPPLPQRNGDDFANNATIPPLPPPAAGGSSTIASIAQGDLGQSSENNNEAAEALQIQNERPNNGNAEVAAPGEFVANNSIDEGVRLISLLQHGELQSDDQFQGAGTRSRRKKVKVICITRCPIGGHFATGSDDGIGRVWFDTEDQDLNCIDKLSREYNSTFDGESMTSLNLSSLSDPMSRTRSTFRGSTSNPEPSIDTLLTTLHGHLNPITDIQYSHEGDRLLTASQKDGLVRIWSWGSETAKTNANGTMKFDQMRQILIRLVYSPDSKDGEKKTPPTRHRRRGGTSSGSASSLSVTCDVATWTTDDSKIITSQSCQQNSSSPAIVPGSHLLHIWDSLTGQCLLSFHSAHDSACPVLVSHPTYPSIFASAGLDGFVKVWSMNTGKCLYSHHNVHRYGHGPFENDSQREKIGGYLDGDFSSDGYLLVLTDDAGFVTVIDALGSEEELQQNSNSHVGSASNPIVPNSSTPPDWMLEQYFANDYYDLFYDSSGYCIERGSRKPPHLAPESARCSHGGIPYSDLVQWSFTRLQGPIPLYEKDVRLSRDCIRKQSIHIRKSGGILAQNTIGKRMITNATTAKAINASLIKGPSNNNNSPRSDALHESQQSSTEDQASSQGTSSRQLSSNYRWIGYDDVLREMREDNGNDELDSDDEEYEVHERRRVHESDDDNLNENDSDDPTESPQARRRNRRSTNGSRRQTDRSGQSRRRAVTVSNATSRRNNTSLQSRVAQQPTRVSGRVRRVQQNYDSDESIVEEMLTRNTRPGGEYIKDYNELGHIFKLPANGEVHRNWVRRTRCELGYIGKKSYSPQVGDSVIYIPRAHYETLSSYPTGQNYNFPWRSWPSNNAWPFVRCDVKNIRYRFPYNDYYGSGDKKIMSIVAILTLEVTGIPFPSNDPESPLLLPQFVSRPSTRSGALVFDVSMFASGEVDFVIPECLYKWRLEQLLEEIHSHPNEGNGIQLTEYYLNDSPTTSEDTEFEQYSAKIDALLSPGNESEMHFQGSGYNSITVSYDDIEEITAISPWEADIETKKDDHPLPTCLSEQQKEAILSIFAELEDEDENFFSYPVDTATYADYLQMIEVPMDISFIRNRLENNYYTNVKSVRADVKLIYDNCLKYNEEDSDIAECVKDFLKTFDIELDDKLNEIDAEPSERPKDAIATIARRNRRSSPRITAHQSSSLEDHLPPPQNGQHGSRDRNSEITSSRTRGRVNRSQASPIDFTTTRASRRSTRSLHMNDDNSIENRGLEISGMITRRSTRSLNIDDGNLLEDRNLETSGRAVRLTTSRTRGSNRAPDLNNAESVSTVIPRRSTRSLAMNIGNLSRYQETETSNNHNENMEESNSSTDRSIRKSLRSNPKRKRDSSVDTKSVSSFNHDKSEDDDSDNSEEGNDDGFYDSDKDGHVTTPTRTHTGRKITRSARSVKKDNSSETDNHMNNKSSRESLRSNLKTQSYSSVDTNSVSSVDSRESEEEEDAQDYNEGVGVDQTPSGRVTRSTLSTKRDESTGEKVVSLKMSTRSINICKTKYDSPISSSPDLPSRRVTRSLDQNNSKCNEQIDNSSDHQDVDDTSHGEDSGNDSNQASRVGKKRKMPSTLENSTQNAIPRIRLRRSRRSSPTKIQDENRPVINIHFKEDQNNLLERRRRSRGAKKDNICTTSLEDAQKVHYEIIDSEGNDDDNSTTVRKSRSSLRNQSKDTAVRVRIKMKNISKLSHDKESHPDAEDVTAENQEVHTTPKRSTRSSNQIKDETPKSTYSKTKYNIELDDKPSKPEKKVRGSPRTRKKYTDLNYEEVRSDIDEEEAEAPRSDIEIETPEPQRIRRTKVRNGNRRNIKNEFDTLTFAHSEQSDDNEDERDTIEAPPTQTKRSKRSAQSTPVRPNKRKRKSTPRKETPVKVDEQYFPIVLPWSGGQVNAQLNEVCHKILEKVIENDVEKIFYEPVIELFPNVEDAYLRKIREPMDFSSIRQKIDSYTDVAHFQDDLIKTYKNCVIFNGVDAQFSLYAISNWEMLSSVFIQVLQELDIDIPRRFASLVATTQND